MLSIVSVCVGILCVLLQIWANLEITLMSLDSMTICSTVFPYTGRGSGLSGGQRSCAAVLGSFSPSWQALFIETTLGLMGVIVAVRALPLVLAEASEGLAGCRRMCHQIFGWARCIRWAVHTSLFLAALSVSPPAVLFLLAADRLLAAHRHIHSARHLALVIDSYFKSQLRRVQVFAR